MAKFKTKLNKWGNSIGIFLPKPLRDTLNLEAGDEVEIEDKEDYIILRKAKQYFKYKIDYSIIILSIVVDRELEELREYKMIFHWCKDHYDDIYNKYNNEWIAVKLPPKIYHNKDLDIRSLA